MTTNPKQKLDEPTALSDGDGYKNASREQLRLALLELRFTASQVMLDMELAPGGDAYAYEGTTARVDQLREAVEAAEQLWLETTPDDDL